MPWQYYRLVWYAAPITMMAILSWFVCRRLTERLLLVAIALAVVLLLHQLGCAHLVNRSWRGKF